MSKAEQTDEKIREQKFRIFSEQSGLCWYCKNPVALTQMELAHRIPQRKYLIKLFGAEVIHNRKNLVGTHPGYCNSKSQLDPESLMAEELAREIQRDLHRAKKRW